jgi:MerR family transcriptional regulator, light-induced transcriptional regulator
MAKPATRMKSIVLKSYIESQAQRLEGSPSPQAEHHGHTDVPDCTGLNVCCDRLTQGIAPVSCSPGLRDNLRAAIEDMVIPRLVIRQCLSSDETALARSGRVLPTPSEIELFARIAAQPDLDNALELALGMQRAGLSLESVLLHLVGPAARLLGTDWEEDTRSFADVTVGLSTLHEVVHLLARREAGDEIVSNATSLGQNRTLRERKQALLVLGPGEQHTLGLFIFAELLQHSRWAVTIEDSSSNSMLLQSVRARSIDMVGISVSHPERFGAVAQLIHALRRASRNRALRVIIGGPVDLTREAQQEGIQFFSDARRAIDWLDGE